MLRSTISIWYALSWNIVTASDMMGAMLGADGSDGLLLGANPLAQRIRCDRVFSLFRCGTLLPIAGGHVGSSRLESTCRSLDECGIIYILPE